MLFVIGFNRSSLPATPCHPPPPLPESIVTDHNHRHRRRSRYLSDHGCAGKVHSGHRATGNRQNDADDESAGEPQTLTSESKASTLIRRGTERVGFEVVTVSGRSGPLASIDSKRIPENRLQIHLTESHRWPTVGRYKVDIREDTDMFLIDEFGKMELFSSSFHPAVLRILNSNIPILASVPLANQGRDIPGVARVKNHPGAIIYMLNTNNRDAYQERIYSQMADLLQKKIGRISNIDHDPSVDGRDMDPALAIQATNIKPNNIILEEDGEGGHVGVAAHPDRELRLGTSRGVVQADPLGTGQERLFLCVNFFDVKSVHEHLAKRLDDRLTLPHVV
ncbi:Nucleoside-triphosphatase THEP1-like protein [Drosera capensis]